VKSEEDLVTAAKTANHLDPPTGVKTRASIQGGGTVRRAFHAPLALGALAAEDSGAEGAPVIYRGAANESARLCGGRVVPSSDFREVADVAVLARVQPAARDKILELDLLALGIRHCNRYPDLFKDSGGIVDLYFNGRRMPLSRFPNQGTMTMKRVFSNTGRQRGEGGTFEYRGRYAPQHERWQGIVDRGVWLVGYWRVPWQIESVRVNSIDTDRHAVTLSRPVQGGIGSKYHRPQGSGREPNSTRTCSCIADSVSNEVPAGATCDSRGSEVIWTSRTHGGLRILGRSASS
jgi:hypothetical protein